MVIWMQALSSSATDYTGFKSHIATCMFLHTMISPSSASLSQIQHSMTSLGFSGRAIQLPLPPSLPPSPPPTQPLMKKRLHLCGLMYHGYNMYVAHRYKAYVMLETPTGKKITWLPVIKLVCNITTPPWRWWTTVVCNKWAGTIKIYSLNKPP